MHTWSPFTNIPSLIESSSLAPQNCLAILGTSLILPGQPFRVRQLTVLKKGSCSTDPLVMILSGVNY